MSGWVRHQASWLIPAGVSILFAIGFCWPLIGRFGDLGVANDWDQHQLFHWVPYASVRVYREIPLWNPFECGGMPMLGNPQSRWLSPFFLVHLWLGHARALVVEIVAHVAIAWLGAFVLGRTYGLSRLAAVAPAVVFAGSSALYLHMGAGHTGWMAYAYTPWALAAFARGWAFAAGALVALMVGEGGTYAAPHTALLLAFLAVYTAITRRSIRPLGDVVVTIIVAAGLAEPKLLVMDELMARLPRLIESAEGTSLPLLWTALFSPAQVLDDEPPGHLYRFLEYGAYIGVVPVLLGIVGALRSRASAAPWLVMIAGGILLTLGATVGGEYSPWALLHRLPIFESQRVPSRFILPTVLAIGMLAGLGIDAMRPLLPSFHRAAATVLLAAGVMDMSLVGPPNLRFVFEQPVTLRPAAPHFVQYRDDTPHAMYPLARANMGAVNCSEALAPVQAARGSNEPAYRGEQYLTGDGEVSLVAWTPHRLIFDVATRHSPNVLVVNQNHHTSWRLVSGDGQVVEYEGLLALRVSGSGRYTLAFESQRFREGVMLAAATLGIGAAAAMFRRRHRIRR